MAGGLLAEDFFPMDSHFMCFFLVSMGDLYDDFSHLLYSHFVTYSHFSWGFRS